MPELGPITARSMWLALTTGRGGRVPTTARSSWTWSVVRWWTCWRIVRRRPRPVGSRIIRKWIRGRQAVRQELFDEIRTLFELGSSVREIARKLGLGRRRVGRWVRRIDLPDLNTMASKRCTPEYFGALLARRWAEGITKVRQLFAEIRHRGYTGSNSHLARFLAPW